MLTIFLFILIKFNLNILSNKIVIKNPSTGLEKKSEFSSSKKQKAEKIKTVEKEFFSEEELEKEAKKVIKPDKIEEERFSGKKNQKKLKLSSSSSSENDSDTSGKLKEKAEKAPTAKNKEENQKKSSSSEDIGTKNFS